MTRRISTVAWTCPRCGHLNESRFATDLWEARKPFEVPCARCPHRESIDPT